jgi:tRNA/rRNA methyltransferase
MTGSGTDKSKARMDVAGPVVVLVEPQLGENIGMCARAMGNFGLTRLRLVKPRDGWPNVAAQRSAAGADHILDKVELFDTVEAAIADVSLLFATTARAHDQAKPVVGPEAAAREMSAHVATGATAAILFGRERYGLENDEVALADRIVTYPVNPGFASLNLAQAVLLMGYEWFQAGYDGPQDMVTYNRTTPASKEMLQGLFEHLEQELTNCGFLRVDEKRPTMVINIRNMLQRAGLTEQEVRTLHGVVKELRYGRRPDRPQRQPGFRPDED